MILVDLLLQLWVPTLVGQLATFPPWWKLSQNWKPAKGCHKTESQWKVATKQLLPLATSPPVWMFDKQMRLIFSVNCHTNGDTPVAKSESPKMKFHNRTLLSETRIPCYRKIITGTTKLGSACCCRRWIVFLVESLSTGAAQIIQQVHFAISLPFFLPFRMFGPTIDNFVAYSAIVSL